MFNEDLKPLKTQKPLFLSFDKKRGSKIKTGGDLLSRSRSTIGARGLNFCVRNGNRCTLCAIYTKILNKNSCCYLFCFCVYYRNIVVCIYSVSSLYQDCVHTNIFNIIEALRMLHLFCSIPRKEQKAYINTVRAISNAQLHIFLCFHLHPINLVVSEGTYPD